MGMMFGQVFQAVMLPLTLQHNGNAQNYNVQEAANHQSKKKDERQIQHSVVLQEKEIILHE
jgi:uncharacterized protein YeaC (DUF1315 family)